MPECPDAGWGPPSCGITDPLAEAVDYVRRFVHQVVSEYHPATATMPAPGQPPNVAVLVAVLALVLAVAALCLSLRNRRPDAAWRGPTGARGWM